MDPQTIPADVLALLQELDTDPDAAIGKLAVLPPKPRARKLQSSDQRIAEELGTVYREETSRLLVQYAQTTVFEDPYWKGLLHRSVRSGVELELIPFESISKRALAVQRGLEEAHREAHEEREHLTKLSRSSSTAGALDAALASWIMHKRDQGAIAAAWEFIRLGEYNSARNFLDVVVERPTSNLHRSYAWEVRGALAIREGKLNEALRAFKTAGDIESDRPAPLCSWLVVASVCAPSEVEEASERIDEMIDTSNPVVESCILTFLTLRDRGLFPGTHAPDLSFGHLAQDSAASRILNVLH